MTRPTTEIVVLGAGILGLWQAVTLARAGYRVTLTDHNVDPLASSASHHAGAMLAPDCEAESAPELVRTLGHHGLQLWRQTYPDVINRGTLVVAGARDQADLIRFGKRTHGASALDAIRIAELEPDLGNRFQSALYFDHESHVSTPDAMAFLLREAQKLGVVCAFGQPFEEPAHTTIIDCRGLGARLALPTLRGVRGERVLIRTHDIALSRPVRLLHPRHPLYVVPWGQGRYLIGATMIETEQAGPVSVRSALELLGAAYALHPAFGEAEILEIDAGVRPAFPDNVPRIMMCDNGRSIFVNGAYRHGFLLAPVLAEAVANHLKIGTSHPLISDQIVNAD
jgi:glycine oxidase